MVPTVATWPRQALDGILIETTGMADPGPVCKTFGLDPVVNRCPGNDRWQVPGGSTHAVKMMVFLAEEWSLG